MPAPDDTLYVLGDVIDRGPDGFKILLDMAQRPNVVNLMGNHEAMALDALSRILNAAGDNGEPALSEDDDEAVELWFFNGGELSLADFFWLNEEQEQTVWEYMSNMPLYKEAEAGNQQFVLVYEGLETSHPLVPCLTTHRAKSYGAAQKKIRPTSRTNAWFSVTLPYKF